MDHAMRFSVSHAATSPFRDDGLRPFFEYRDLGIRDATGNRFVARQGPLRTTAAHPFGCAAVRRGGDFSVASRATPGAAPPFR